MNDLIAAFLAARASARHRVRRSTAIAGLGLLAMLGGLHPGIAAAAPRAHASVVGASRIPIEDAPFQVAIYDPQITPGPGEVANPVQSQFCAGVILDATQVLTAGHCVMNQEPRGVASPAQVEVLAGTDDINTADGQPAGYIEDPVAITSFNPAWNPVEGEHDVGLLTLQQPLWSGLAPSIDGTNKVAPIPLASAVPPFGSMLRISGWGYDKELIGEARPSEEAGFQRYLQSAQIPLISPTECAADYQAIKQAVPSSVVCAGDGGHGACYSDSGGPLFEGPMTPPGTYRLLGIVDFGNGCGEAGFPGFFQSLIDEGNLQFALSDPPQAPLEQSAPEISGTPLPGQKLTCSAGSWSGNPIYTYRFYADEASASDPDARSALTSASSPEPTYTLSAAYAGRRIFCVARATNAGGYNFDRSSDVSVAGEAEAGTAAGAQSSPSTHPAPPTLTLISKSCVRMRCVVNVRASAGIGGGAVASVRATLSFKRRGACRVHRKHMKCLHTSFLDLQVRAMPGGHFVILTGLLQAGTYRLTSFATDKAGIRQVKPTVLTLVVKRAEPKH